MKLNKIEKFNVKYRRLILFSPAILKKGGKLRIKNYFIFRGHIPIMFNNNLFAINAHMLAWHLSCIT